MKLCNSWIVSNRLRRIQLIEKCPTDEITTHLYTRGRGGAIIGLVEVDVGKHGAEEQRQAAGKPLYSCESTSMRTTKHTEPDVTICYILLGSAPEYEVEVSEFFLSSHWHHSVNLLVNISVVTE